MTVFYEPPPLEDFRPRTSEVDDELVYDVTSDWVEWPDDQRPVEIIFKNVPRAEAMDASSAWIDIITEIDGNMRIQDGLTSMVMGMGGAQRLLAPVAGVVDTKELFLAPPGLLHCIGRPDEFVPDPYSDSIVPNRPGRPDGNTQQQLTRVSAFFFESTRLGVIGDNPDPVLFPDLGIMFFPETDVWLVLRDHIRNDRIADVAGCREPDGTTRPLALRVNIKLTYRGIITTPLPLKLWSCLL